MRNEHSDSEHLKRQPNGKVPVLEDGNLSIFESGAILLYLVNKYDKEHKIWRSSSYLLIEADSGSDPQFRWKIMSWLFLQVTSLGPIVWQYLHWEHRKEMQEARPVLPLEILRVLGILEKRLCRPGTIG